MATKLNGMLNLSKIPKELIGETKKKEKCIFVDVVPKKNGADQYGYTHSIQIYNKNTKETIYLGDLKPQEFGEKASQGAPQNVPPQGAHEQYGQTYATTTPQNDDLPFR